MAAREDREEDDNVIAARWVLAIEEGLAPGEREAFHAWLAAHPDRAELIARQAALHSLAAAAPPRSLAWDRRMMIGGGAAALGAAAVGALVLSNRFVTEQRYATATGELQEIELPDASRVWLDARTRAAVRFSASVREVLLTEGRFFIEAARDRKRPLLVRCASFEARALGTAFEVTALAGRAGIAVTEGLVRLTTASSAIEAPAGEAAWVSASGRIERASAIGVGAWRERRMVLSDRRLDDALVELNRYFERPLIVTDAEIAARRVSLSFSIIDMSASDAAALISAAVGAAPVDDGARGVILAPAPASRERSSGL